MMGRSARRWALLRGTLRMRPRPASAETTSTVPAIGGEELTEGSPTSPETQSDHGDAPTIWARPAGSGAGSVGSRSGWLPTVAHEAPGSGRSRPTTVVNVRGRDRAALVADPDF